MTTDKTERKRMPIAKGCLDYFPDALAEVAHVSYVGNAQHNPGQEMHWDKSKSPDHADCIARHLLERGTLDDDGLRHSAKVAWRALAMLQIEIEREQTATKIWEAGYAAKTRPNYIPQLLKLGCSEEVCKQVFGGLTYRVANAISHKGLLYVAGPMRKVKDYNFPMFDKARDAALKDGWDVISPADIDRASPFTQADVENQAVFVLRDFWSLFLVAHNAGKGILLLPRWDQSRGASAEYALAKWLRIPVFAFEPTLGQIRECA